MPEVISIIRKRLLWSDAAPNIGNKENSYTMTKFLIKDPGHHLAQAISFGFVGSLLEKCDSARWETG